MHLGSRPERDTRNAAETFAELYERYLPRVFRYISYQVGNMDLAEDLTSAVFEKVLTRLDSYRSDKAAFSTWLLTIARNTVIDYYRVKSRKLTISIEETFEPASEEISPEEKVIRKEELKSLNAYLRELPQQEREIVSLKFGAELNNRQIAKILDLSESNVGTILYRVICKLRDKFKEG
jgi:RNA polymerase sigma-70 factor (ECF subfamily)